MNKPQDLGVEGSALWDDITEWGEELRPDEYRTLTLACRALDGLDEMRRAFEEGGRQWIVKGSTGQPTINPLKSEIRFLTGTFASLIRQLQVPDTEERALQRADDISKKMSELARKSHGPGSKRSA